ncbi:hypothetical protein FPY71_17905 [Aureimonas fodinaquatilis]|uniref:Uncharacterized protein n=1 Tax=Aureimonas fodinaquatilis TaxID=2565783 RepID=A0A5B0DSU6_9HYPH|nr:hypothetical protein [Aureimonas fodinaquatilis]KAA0968199.1 hypothetical protein FPY71_17905 [Aureimonas fodinaquatilis]
MRLTSDLIKVDFCDRPAICEESIARDMIKFGFVFSGAEIWSAASVAFQQVLPCSKTDGNFREERQRKNLNSTVYQKEMVRHAGWR